MDQIATGKGLASGDGMPERSRRRDGSSHVDQSSKGWMGILARTKDQITEDNLTIVAAGVAFYAFVAVVPALGALIGLYALLADARQIGAHIGVLARVVPAEVMPLLEDQIKRLTSNDKAAGWSAVLGLLLAIYSSSAATKALITGMNIAHDETEKRGFLKLNAIALSLTFFVIVGGAVAVGLVAILPGVLDYLPVSTKAETFVSWSRWPLLIAGFMTGLAVFYRFGVSRKNARWKWASPGAVIATLFWVVGSGLFSLYVAKLGSYDKTYGSLGAVVVFLLWLYLSALSILIGAEINSKIERRTLSNNTENSSERRV